MREVSPEIISALDDIKSELRELAALGIDQSDPLLFTHHLREIFGDAQKLGLSVDWETFKEAYRTEQLASQRQAEAEKVDAPAEARSNVYDNGASHLSPDDPDHPQNGTGETHSEHALSFAAEPADMSDDNAEARRDLNTSHFVVE